MEDVRHILITTDREDSARLLVRDSMDGGPPRVWRSSQDGQWRAWHDTVLPGSTRQQLGIRNASRRALPLLWAGQPTGALATARALEVLTLYMWHGKPGGMSHPSGFMWHFERSSGLWCLTFDVRGVGCRYHFGPHGVAAWGPQGSDGTYRPEGRMVPALADCTGPHRNLWALAAVLTALVPGCGAEIVPQP